MTLISTASVAYPLHAILSYVFAICKKCWIYNGHTLASFPTVCCHQKPLEKEEDTENEEISSYRFILSMTVLLECSVRVTTGS